MDMIRWLLAPSVLLILVVIPLGARDIKRMFARLDDSAASDENDP